MFNFNKASEVLPLIIYKSKALGIKDLEIFLNDTLNDKFNVKVNDNVIEVKTNIKYKKEVVKSYNSYTILDEGIHYSISLDAFSDETKTPKILSEKDEVIKKILEFSNVKLDRFKSFNNRLNTFIEVKNTLQKNGILSILKADEFIIAHLPIDSLNTELIEVDKKHRYNLLLTSKRKLIVSSQVNIHSEIIDLSQHKLEYNPKTGKDYIHNDIISFYTEFFNDSLFEELQFFIEEKAPYSIELFGDILFNRNKMKSSEIEEVKNVYNLAFLKSEKFTASLKENLIDTFVKKEFDESKIEVSTLLKLINHSDFDSALSQMFSDWEIDVKQKEHFLNFLLKQKDSYKLSKVSSFYKSIFNLKESSKKGNDLAFKVNYAKFLNEAKLFEEAVPQYQSIIDSIKNQSVLEMLSDNKADIINGTDANGLLIELLDEIVEIKKRINANYDNELLKLAQLQPLNIERIKRLKQINSAEVLEKVNVLLTILDSLDFSFNGNEFQFVEETYTKEEIFNNIVPKSYDNAKGFFDTITSLIAQIVPPDYKSVTEFSDKITSDSQSDIFKIVENVAKSLSLDEVECFFGRGNFSKSIIGVEGKPNFLIIGSSYLDDKDELYMTKKELQFAVTTELSHILFEHTRITAQDVWRGAKSKSLSFAQVLLVALPALGTISNLVGRFVDITKFKKVLTGVNTVSNTIDKGQTVIDYGSKITDFFSKNQDEEQTLLATSRLMEISADRVGLLITKDLKSTVSSMFKLDDDFDNFKKDIIEKGLYNFLAQKNENDEFLRQNYILRIKTLFSFYLQVEFDR